MMSRLMVMKKQKLNTQKTYRWFSMALDSSLSGSLSLNSSWPSSLWFNGHWPRHYDWQPVVRGSTLCLKKVPTFKLSVPLSNLNRFSKLLTVGKRMKFATKFIQHYPSHLNNVAALPWKIKNANFSADIQHIWKKLQTNCILSPKPLLCIHKFWYFQRVK